MTGSRAATMCLEVRDCLATLMGEIQMLKVEREQLQATVQACGEEMERLRSELIRMKLLMRGVACGER